MEKTEFIENNKKVKIVIGNGFDLHCGLMSSYGNYFEYYEAKYNYIKSWIQKYSGNLVAKRFFGPTLLDCWEPFDKFDEVNVWDLFFEIITDDSQLKEKARWCDIEEEILFSLVIPSIDGINVKKQPICWKDVYSIINGEKKFENKTFNFIALSAFVFKKHGGLLFEDENSFYEFLLNELRKFEINFGKYLKRQHDYFDHFINHHNADYDMKAAETISSLGEDSSLVSIDSFNFGTFNNEKYDAILRRINGTLDMPIFGIDSTVFKSDDVRFIFSKTNRRMEMDMIVHNASIEPSFNNVVVYGHSLNKSDYSYFFPLLDKLEMTDFTSNMTIVFAFTIYKQDQSYQIKQAHRKAIQELFSAYAIFKGYQTNPERLLDSLTTQGRIVSCELPLLDGVPSYFWN
ncbi:MAG: hypothetical protein J6T25_03495 [Bacilli bacterium]|nr:hypothetical protein [Bacilli bacterium]